MAHSYDFIIIGSGIIGLTVARGIKQERPPARILLIDKETDVGYHASGRNSGVLHAGFYYSADSFKAKFTVAGNRAMKEYCRAKNIAINECGKLVVAQSEPELKQLYELERRGIINGSNVKIIDAPEAERIDPNVRTFQKALYSPDTASIDPVQVCQTLKRELQEKGVEFLFQAKYLGRKGETVQTTKGDFTGGKIINSAGLYADKIAQDFGFGQSFRVIPFKGLYLKYTRNKTDVRVNIYPVPDLRNPFLGVHFTKTVTGQIKIGPTAIPALWRENYAGLDRFNGGELGEILFQEAGMFIRNSNNFRNLAFTEIRKYNKAYFVQLAARLVKDIDPAGFTEFSQPGIRAQLLNTKTMRLVEDFVIEADDHSIHILNAVSPAFTCAFPFAQYVIKEFILK